MWITSQSELFAAFLLEEVQEKAGLGFSVSAVELMVFLAIPRLLGAYQKGPIKCPNAHEDIYPTPDA